MKKVIITENALRFLINEMVIGEIATDDLYSSFYKDKLPKEIFLAIMKGTNKLTPYHRKALDLAVAETSLDNRKKLEFSAKIGDAWVKCPPDGRQMLISKTANEDNLEFMSITAERISSKKHFTESSWSKAGLRVLYEDNGIIVTCTLSYAASKQNFGHTEWCTASGIDGRDCGYFKFKQYTWSNNTCLIQFVNKLDRNEAYQATYSSDGVPDDIYDIHDTKISEDNLISAVDVMSSSSNYESIISKIPFSDLVTETMDNVSDEDEMWYDKIDKIITATINDVKSKIKSGFYESLILQWLKYHIAGDERAGEFEKSFFETECPIYVSPIMEKDGILVASAAYRPTNREKTEWMLQMEDEYQETLLPEETFFFNIADESIIKRMPYTWADKTNGNIVILREEGYGNGATYLYSITSKLLGEGIGANTFTLQNTGRQLIALYTRVGKVDIYDSELGKLYEDAMSVRFASGTFVSKEGQVRSVYSLFDNK